MRKNIRFSLLLMCLPLAISAQSHFSTSLHATREGKNDAYKAANGGMERITAISMSELSCQKCHSATETYPNGTPIDPATYSPGCNDCHDFAQGHLVTEETCLNCHSRQKNERTAYPGMDVHTAAGMTCVNCHSEAEIHGDDGIAYASLKQPGAIQAKCENCHTELPSNSSHLIHAKTVDCAACHAVGVQSCTSCHFESVLASGKNRALNQIGNYKLLLKHNGEIRLGNFMTNCYAGVTNTIISSYHSHAIQKNGGSCADCHHNMQGTNVAIAEYNESGQITLTTWSEETKKMTGPTGVIPVPGDWGSALRMDFATYTGDPTLFPSDPDGWTYLTSDIDNAHLYYADPLDSAILAKLGFTRLPSAVGNAAAAVPKPFALRQNYPNPFNPATTIEFTLTEPEQVSLIVYDLNGREMTVLVDDENMAAGTHARPLDASHIPSGVYLCVLTAPDGRQTRTMIVMK